MPDLQIPHDTIPKTRRPLRILYGVQATGQGHIARARIMAPALAATGPTVDFLFSGRPRDKLYNMDVFGDFQTRTGLTLYFNDKGVSHLRTIFNNRAGQFIKDVAQLDLTPYDLVITDYEPVTAWAALAQGKPSLGIGNQYAYAHNIPKVNFHPLDYLVMHGMAPVETALGLHWHHFDQPILPPLFEPPANDNVRQKNKIVVYLNFENLAAVTRALAAFPDHDFYIYHDAVKAAYDEGHLKFRPPSQTFKQDLADCDGIICNAGFGLVTEGLHMGKKMLVKAADRQPEQESNVLTLEVLDLTHTMHGIDEAAIAAWLPKTRGRRILYPNTAAAIATWIGRRSWSDPSPLIENLWSQVKGFSGAAALPPRLRL